MHTLIMRIVAIMGIILVTGCSSVMKNAAYSFSAKAEADSANIVFMRSTFVSSAIGVELFEVKDGKLEFIGQLPNGSKLVYKTSPGQKVFMAYGVAADFMLADVVGGKTYYSIVRPNWGSGGFIPTPIRAGDSSNYNMKSKDFQTWLKNTDLLEKKPGANEWFVKKKDEFQKIYETYWAQFGNKTPEQKQERTLHPNDGI